MGWVMLALIGAAVTASGVKLHSPVVFGFGVVFSVVAVVGSFIAFRRNR